MRTRQSSAVFAGVLMLALGCSGDGGDQEGRQLAEPKSQADADCGKRALDSCSTDSRCHLIPGRALDRTRGCWKASEPLGCRMTDLICGLALTTARNPAGQCFLFSNTCIALGWSTIYGSSDKLCRATTPVCD
jgi:hypothetical protein